MLVLQVPPTSLKGNGAFVDLRYVGEDSISPSTQFVAAIKN